MRSHASEPQRHALRVDDILRMVGAGILAEDARVELLDGELIDMTPINAPHSGIVNRLNRLFVQAAGDRAVVSVQNAVRLSDVNLPQPDFTLLRARPDDYFIRLPTVGDVLLIVEVSDTTLAFDRDRKLPIYALHEVPEVWLIDVNRRKLFRHRDPSPKGYRKRDAPSGSLAPGLLPDCRLEVASIFPG